MSLDVMLTEMQPSEVFTYNITHNLNKMADAAGLYEALWRPEEIGCVKAGDLIDKLSAGLSELVSNPEFYKEYNPHNGWGSYENLVEFVGKYLVACITHPNADIRVSR